MLCNIYLLQMGFYPVAVVNVIENIWDPQTYNINLQYDLAI
jgi:hypothetical protein